MQLFNGCANYTLLSLEELPDINGVGYILQHDKTGARVVLIANDDDNKTFLIGFKTPQNNSTGVPHILEHSVLCGSKKYPVKDAMTEIMKGSLNTFLNALTYPDRTLYPVASCNDKDFDNLMSVYLDAVFFPRVYDERKIFEQEGWHYELESPEGELTYNGVVYNEMKGVYSSPQSCLASYSMFSLFPDTQYGVESGGDPECIPNLSYEEFLDFHRKLYNPSNARIYLYGDMDFASKLEYIDREYLSKFEKVNDLPKVVMQVPFETPSYVEKEYSVSDLESGDKAAFLSYNVVVADYRDTITDEAMDAIDYALCAAPGSILERRLLDAGIGTNIYSDYTTDLCQKVYSIVAEDADAGDRDRFVSIIEDTIKEIIENGFDKRALEAAITTSEFSYREADFGYYPKGIAYAFMTLDNWNYTDDNIFSNLKMSSVFGKLREGINNGLFENILKERFLNNNHKSVIVLKPKSGLQREKDEALKEKLAKYKASLSEAEISKIVSNTVALKKYQEEPDDEESLKTIPTLSLEDINKKAKEIKYTVSKIGNINELYTELPTNGIAYFNLSFSMDKIPFRLYPAVALLKALLGMVDTKVRTYKDITDEVNIISGGIAFTAGVSKMVEGDDFKVSFDIKSKALYRNIGKVFNLIKEILFTSKLDDKKRVRELLEMGITKTEDYMVDSGHSVSLNRAFSYLGVPGKISEVLSGLDRYYNDVALSQDFENKYDAMLNDMQEAISLIFKEENLLFAYASEESHREEVRTHISEFVKNLSTADTDEAVVFPAPEALNEGLMCESQVQYVCMTGDYKKAGLKNSARLGLIRNILSTDYLWTEVRLKGGAYGVYCVFSKSGEAGFVSYRDPNISKSMEAYRGASDYIRNFNGDNKLVERFIITTIGDLDTPLTASMQFARALNYYRTGMTNETAQKDRDELLATTVDDIRNLYKYIDAVIDSNTLCVLGNGHKIESEKELFGKIKPLLA